MVLVYKIKKSKIVFSSFFELNKKNVKMKVCFLVILYSFKGIIKMLNLLDESMVATVV